MKKVDRTVRRAQTITPFGVGGVYDFGSESFVAMDTTKWRCREEPDLRLPRLERVLGVEGFRAAPIADNSKFPGATRGGGSTPYYRFPAWLFCPTCRAMYKWGPFKETEGAVPSCSNCGKRHKLVPMRFVAVCGHGHLTDIPWDFWAHLSPNGKPEHRDCKNKRVYFKSWPDRGAGLQSLYVECRNCGAQHDLEQIPKKDSLRRVWKHCPGTQPWQKNDLAAPCDRIPQAVQRGASNAYFPVVESAIDIRAGFEEDESLFDLIRAHPGWTPLLKIKALVDAPDNKFAKTFIDPIVRDEHLESLGVTVEHVWDCLHDSGVADAEVPPVDSCDDELLNDEWSSFLSPPEIMPNAEFMADIAPLDAFGEHLPEKEQPVWKEFRRLIGQVTLARRLRIVRALKGFNRLEPNREMLVSPSLGATTNWLPAVEIYGEGIFVALDPRALETWEKRVPNKVLAAMRHAREKTTLDFLPEATNRFVLLHTLAHLLIRQLCFECGYSSSSISERIYSDEETGMAGLLLYTASSDSEGALGGLVRQGIPENFYGTLKTALFRAAWCSSDPICSEMEKQGSYGLNKSACHACTLVAETSCDHANCLLDRSVLLGTKNTPGVGFFSNFVALMEA